jgi:hypothetical protein
MFGDVPGIACMPPVPKFVIFGFSDAGLAAAGGAAGALEGVPPELELPTAEPVDDSDDAPCANATPVIIANAAAPASQCLAISSDPYANVRASIRSFKSLCNCTWGGEKRSDRIGKYLVTRSRPVQSRSTRRNALKSDGEGEMCILSCTDKA